jgi:hypothetical protein
VEFEQVRTLTHEVLKEMLRGVKKNPNTVTNFTGNMQRTNIVGQVEQIARQRGHLTNQDLSHEERRFVVEALWQLVIQGILIPGTFDGDQGWPFVSFTEHGERTIQEEGPTPYDPDRYLEQFRGGNVDPVVSFYVEEALGSFTANRHTSCVVMLGVASERVLDLLHSAFLAALASQNEREKLMQKANGKMLVVRYGELKKRLEPKKDQLPQAMRDNLDTTLTSIFNIIRQLRNDAGHPTGRQMTRDEAYALLYLFPYYHAQMSALIEHLEANPDSLT